MPSRFLSILASALAISGPALSEESSSADAISSPARQSALRLQLFLDREKFRPGRLDARWGEFSEKAVQRWNAGHPDRQIEIPAEGVTPGPDSFAEAKWDKPLTIDYTVTKEDVKTVGKVAGEPVDMAEQDSLPYESVVELVAERFHAYVDFILELNDRKPGETIKAGDTLIVPNIAQPFLISDAQALKNAKDGESAKPTVEVFVDRDKEVLEVSEDGTVVASFPITPGSQDLPAPEGEWEIDTIAWMPEFRYDEKMLEKGERSDEAHMLPPGPNNPVGIVWLGINSDGIGIHGTKSPDTIGRSSSHGCVRLANWDAYDLGKMIDYGTKVVIR